MGEGREPAFEREPDPCCPLCTTEAVQHLEYDASCDDWACPNCGLCAPTPVMQRIRETVDRLEERDQPDLRERIDYQRGRIAALEAEIARLKQPATPPVLTPDEITELIRRGARHSEAFREQLMNVFPYAFRGKHHG